MFTFLRKSKNILGMNARNLVYLRPYNFRHARRIADDKILTKKALLRAGIPTSRFHGAIRDRNDLNDFDFSTLPPSFVLKPNYGYGGGGIKVIFGRRHDGTFIGSGGERLTEDHLREHIINILDGNFSLHNVPDVAFFEDRVRITKQLKPYSYQGIPDVRVIVFNGVPIMAMLRLSTAQSQGKANLHLGGIGVGIDIADGVTTSAIQRRPFLNTDTVIEYIPKTRLLLSGIPLPLWNEVLRIAIKTQQVIGLGYIGVDISYDRDHGPLVFEANARPGLSIQNANLAPLKDRLRRVKGITVRSTSHGIRLAKELFGGDVERELEDVSGRKVIGSKEEITLTDAKGETITVLAKIDTGADSTSFDIGLAERLGFKEAYTTFKDAGLTQKMTIEEVNAYTKEQRKELAGIHDDIVDVRDVKSSSGATLRPYVRLRYVMAGRPVVGNASIVDRSGMECLMIVGRKDLKRFLVDVKK